LAGAAIADPVGMSVVLIARADQAAVLRKRIGVEPSGVLFADCDALKALDSIMSHPPRIVALDRGFVGTARGAALVARLKTTPHLRAVDVRVLAEDEMHLPLILNAKNPCHDVELLKASHPVDYWGTRRAPRFTVARDAGVVVNGERGQLVNLSSTGAQVIASARMRPDEALRVSLVDAAGEVKVRAVVAWSSAVQVGHAMGYRAGLDFINPDSLMLETFSVRHFAAPDRAYGAP
jgi:hypothetical protein